MKYEEIPSGLVVSCVRLGNGWAALVRSNSCENNARVAFSAVGPERKCRDAAKRDINLLRMSLEKAATHLRYACIRVLSSLV